MKATLLIIIGMFVFSILVPEGFSQCVYNDDWPAAPCFDMGKVNKFHYKWAWAPYYIEKGGDVMKSKHTEMHDALKNETIDKWVNSSLQNWNVYNYYRSVGDIQSQFPYDVELIDSYPSQHLEQQIIIILAVTITVLSITCIRYRRNRK